MDEYKAQLLACEAKLAKESDNELLLELKKDLLEAIECCALLDDDEEDDSQDSLANNKTNSQSGSVRRSDDRGQKTESNKLVNQSDQEPSGSGGGDHRRPLSEAELLAKKKEKNRKKKEKLREKIKQQLDTAESEKQSWQSFANKRGLKGVTKKSIFASPCSVTGKVGVGTNGIADAPSVGGATSSTSSLGAASKRRHY